MSNERLQELAQGLALGELNAAEEEEFFALMPQSRVADRSSLLRIFDASAVASMGMPVALPPAALKGKVLGSILGPQAAPESSLRSLHFIPRDDGKGWEELPIKGAFVKPLSIDSQRGHAVVLGKLSPGASYPPHTHTGPEDVYIISGDLTIGSTRMGPGDFHHAEAGSEHGINFSEGGCMVLAVLTVQDLQAQYAAARAMAGS